MAIHEPPVAAIAAGKECRLVLRVICSAAAAVRSKGHRQQSFHAVLVQGQVSDPLGRGQRNLLAIGRPERHGAGFG